MSTNKLSEKLFEKQSNKPIKAILARMRKSVRHQSITWYKGLNTFQILVGAVLSARTRDPSTEQAVRALFRYYPTPEKLARAPLSKIRKLIKFVGFYKIKAKYIKDLSKILVRKYNGKVPKDRVKLQNLPGVGPKVSAIVLSFGFGFPIIPVDVHVHRVSNRIGLVQTQKPLQTEHKLMAVVPKKYWRELNELFVLFGQNICLPRKPNCFVCPIKKWCDYYAQILAKNYLKQ